MIQCPESSAGLAVAPPGAGSVAPPVLQFRQAMSDAGGVYPPGAALLGAAMRNGQLSVTGPDAGPTLQRFANALADPDFARDVQGALAAGKRIEIDTHQGSSGQGLPFSSNAELGGSRMNLYTDDYARADPTRVLVHEFYHLVGLDHGPAQEARIAAATDTRAV